MNTYRSYPENQIIFEKNFGLIQIITGWIARTLIYAPLLVGGYLITKYLLATKNNFWLYLSLTIGFAYAGYLLIFFIKGVIICLKANRSFWWIPLFAMISFFVCILPILVFLQSNFNWINRLVSTSYFRLGLIAAYAIYTYTQYRFLSDSAPRSIFAVYKAGIFITEKIIRFKVPRTITSIVFGK